MSEKWNRCERGQTTLILRRADSSFRLDLLPFFDVVLVETDSFSKRSGGTSRAGAFPLPLLALGLVKGISNSDVEGVGGDRSRGVLIGW